MSKHEEKIMVGHPYTIFFQFNFWVDMGSLKMKKGDGVQKRSDVLEVVEVS